MLFRHSTSVPESHARVASFVCRVVPETDNRLLFPGQRSVSSSPLLKVATGDDAVGNRKLVPSDTAASFNIISGDMASSSDVKFMIHSAEHVEF